MKHKGVLGIGLAVYTTLLLLAIVYYKERTVILDSAYHLFQILYHQSLAIQGNRFGAALTQLYPVMAMKMGFSLHTVVIAYSLSFIIFFLLTFLLTLFWVKNTKMALCILLFNVLMVTHTFYWPHPELPAGIVFTLFYLAWADHFLQGNLKGRLFLAVSPPFLITIVFFHPLLIIVFFFICSYFFLLYRTAIHRKAVKFLVWTVAGYCLILILKALLFRSSYESGAMSGLKNIITLFPDYFSIVSNKNLIRYFIHDYYFVPLLLFIVVLFYIRKKEFCKLFLVLAFFFGLCFIVNINYANGADQFYLEAQYLLLSLFVIFPFVYEVLPRIRKPQLAFSIVLLLTGTSIMRIWDAHDFYAGRVDWYRKFMAGTSKLHQQKLILAPDAVPMKTLMLTWGSSYEFWLLSTLEQGASRSVIIEERKGEFDWRMGDNKAEMTKWEQFEYAKMDRRYFLFSDTTYYTHYSEMPYSVQD